ncbi:response regulator transcription factor [Pelagibius litoralis]|uniref:Response regulator transcription factor n=1 Tax=Pelagibius litoralis TaxID=374515 RepID=A0A967KD08_9PROT|nr:response regulator transcription factor [Pelagibius litoralis]NIA71159.1 response regulator transcription factor [Pelagibius litoralis]
MKVLYADDHWITRSAARHLIDRLESGSELLEAADFRQALDMASANPDLDLILLDLLMPGMKRFEGLRAIRECLPQVPVVVMSAIEDRDEILRCIEAGAMGYIPKSSQSEEVESALQTVLAGGVAFPRRLLEQRSPAKKQTVHAFGKDKSLEDVSSALTKRQLQVYKLLGQGMSNAQVAEALGLSEHTVRVHVSAIVKRLNLDSRTQAAISAAAQAQTIDEEAEMASY